MLFKQTLVHGRLLQRRQRFFVDVQLDSGETVVAHCPNTGSLKGCVVAGSEVYLEPASNPERKLKWTWVMVKVEDVWVGVDTSRAVPLVEEAISEGLIPSLQQVQDLKREVKYGKEGRSRIDLLIKDAAGLKVYVEVKNTTLCENKIAMFPDAVTERGQKHLQELMLVVEQGHRAMNVYCVQRSDCTAFAPASHIDVRYAKMFEEARARGVEMAALLCTVEAEGIRPLQLLPL